MYCVCVYVYGKTSPKYRSLPDYKYLKAPLDVAYKMLFGITSVTQVADLIILMSLLLLLQHKHHK